MYGYVYESLKTEDNISSGLYHIWNDMKNLAMEQNQLDLTNYLSEDSNDWMILQHLDTLFSYAMATNNDDKILKMPIDFSQSLMEQLYKSAIWQSQWTQMELDELHQFFTLPKTDLNLIAIGHLYTLNHFAQLGGPDTNLFKFEDHLYLGGHS